MLGTVDVRRRITVVAAVLLVGALTASSIYLAGKVEPLHVADLVKQADCTGAVSAPQEYSYEAARCRREGVEVTIAVFDTSELRDQWITLHRGRGGYLIRGHFWAARTGNHYTADELAAILHGSVLTA